MYKFPHRIYLLSRIPLSGERINEVLIWGSRDAVYALKGIKRQYTRIHFLCIRQLLMSSRRHRHGLREIPWCQMPEELPSVHQVHLAASPSDLRYQLLWDRWYASRSHIIHCLEWPHIYAINSDRLNHLQLPCNYQNWHSVRRAHVLLVRRRRAEHWHKLLYVCSVETVCVATKIFLTYFSI